MLMRGFLRGRSRRGRSTHLEQKRVTRAGEATPSFCRISFYRTIAYADWAGGDVFSGTGGQWMRILPSRTQSVAAPVLEDL